MTGNTSAAPHGALAAKIRGTLKRVLPIGLLLISLAAIAGCNLIRDGYLADPPFIQKDRIDNADGPPPPINLDEYVFPFDVEFCHDSKCDSGGIITIIPNEITKLKAVGSAEPEADEKAKPKAYDVARTAAALVAGSNDVASKKKAIHLRNVLYGEISQRSYEICQFHKAGIIGYGASTNFATGFLATSLSAISAAVGGEAAKTIFSTTSAVIGAGRAEFNAEIFQNLLATAILKKIEEERIKKKTALDEKLDIPIDEYTVEEMLVEVVKYHYACSFMDGLVQLASGTQRKVATRAEIDAEIKSLEKQNEDLATAIEAIYVKLKAMAPGEQPNRRRALEKQVRSHELGIEQNSARLIQLRAMRFSAGVRTVSEGAENKGPEPDSETPEEENTPDSPPS